MKYLIPFILFFTQTVLAQALDSKGWSVFTPSADTRKVYVSMSGNDSNDGLSEATPKKTLAAGWSLIRDGFPDWLLLKSGDSFSEDYFSFNKSGRSENEKLLLSSYGVGDRPKLMPVTTDAIYAGNWGAPRQHVAIVGIAASGERRSGGIKGIVFLGFWADVLIEDCKLELFFNNLTFDIDPTQTMVANIKVRRNVILDSYQPSLEGHPQGIYAAGMDGLLLDGNVFDHNGWSETIPGAVPTIFRRNVYIQYNVKNAVTKDNISARSGSEGMQQRPGGLADNNLFLKNSGDFLFATGGVCKNNVMLDSKDIDPSLPRGAGLMISGNGATGIPTECFDNIMAYRGPADNWNVTGISLDHGSKLVTLHHNIVYNWFTPLGVASGSAATIFDVPDSSVTFRDNDFQQTTGGSIVSDDSGRVLFANNRYFSLIPNPFASQGSWMNFAQWTALKSDTSVSLRVPYSNPNRNISTYMGKAYDDASGLDAFLAGARKQSKATWNLRYTAMAVNDYIRVGFDKPILNNCPADINGDGALNIADFSAFLQAYASGDMRTDFNHSGSLNVLDFTSYLIAYVGGCH